MSASERIGPMPVSEPKRPERTLPEPWLRGTLADVPAVARAALHALELAREDLHKWCSGLTDEEVNLRPEGIAPVAFHIRHIARSADRLLTYAEGRALTPEQIAVMKTELAPAATTIALFAELDAACDDHARRIRALSGADLDGRRTVGGQQLPTTLGGLLVHVAEHTQRHTGQAVTTSQIVVAQRNTRRAEAI
jgi:uncharacterized damage-inducible protein DinB